MNIALASDHAGFEFKHKLISRLKKMGHTVFDVGCNSAESCDYPDYGVLASKRVVEGLSDRAIIVCTNGIGMSMTANKIPGILAAVVYSVQTAITTRKHHDSNVLCLGAKEFPQDELFKMADVWLATDFEGGRHERRVNKIRALDEAKLC